jgi:1-acyl-sn-glycerol-3-phosphate acyltransferase
LPLLKLVNGYMGTELRGWENMPKGEPLLIVGNHSGGALTMDPIPLITRWIEAWGTETPLYALAYDLLFSMPGIGPLLPRVGCVPASHHNAGRALEKGASVIVFPGGDYEVFRPWRERNQIQFGGRMGFIELALNMGVRVVPMTIHGAHESTFVMTRGHQIAKSIGLDRLKVKVCPITWSIPFGPVPAVVPSLPLPTKVTVQLGRPLDWSHFSAEQADNPEVLQHCYDEITGVMQGTLDDLARERPYPALTRLGELRPDRLLGHLTRPFRSGA